jgi:methylated-DNA-protein-cysteine methyltransferase related protein
MPPRNKLDPKLKRRLLAEDSRPQLTRDQAIARVIATIPKGKVATYGQVAAAAGYPLHHRAAARLLRHSHGTLPWQRVVGAGGAIKTRMDLAVEQRLRLQMEGVAFSGKCVDMETHQHFFKTWEL